MKNQSLILLLFTLIFALTACGDETFEDDAFLDEEDGLTADDCFDDEVYDPETQDCYLAEDFEEASDENEGGLTAEDCYEDEIYDPETQSCIFEISCEDDEECELALAELYTDEELANLEFLAMSEDECLPGELYDPEEQVCYIECDTDEECNQLAEEIYSGLDVYLVDSYSGATDAPSTKSNEPTEAEPVDLPNDLSGGDPELPTIARYTVNDNLDIQLVGIDEAEADNEERYQEIWVFLRHILPPNIMKSDVAEYHIFTDGADETLAYVSPLADNANVWLIGIDIADAGQSGKINTPDFVHTTIHEFAHILTLEDDQVPPDTSRTDDDEASDIELSCATFYTGEGCALVGSYINQFFNKFWADDYYNEFQDVLWAETDDEYYDNLYAFYETREDQFVTEYAGTNPGEDIAESFTYFVLQDKPTGNSIAEQKILFFYDYPAMVAMRNHIRGELARMP